MALSKVPCLIGQAACGRVAGQPVCAKCGMDERVVYPGQADREAAQTAALARYAAAHEAVKPPPPPDPPKPPTPPEPPAQPPKQAEPESPVTPGRDNKGIHRLGVGVLVLALLGGGLWWKDQQDQRVQQAQAQAAQQALAAEAARREREAGKKRADEAEAQRVASEKAQAQIAEQARRNLEAEKKRADEAERAARVAQQRPAAAATPAARPSEQTAALLHGRYQILANGSEVKDVQTGLVWARCSVGQQWDGSTCAGEAKALTIDATRNVTTSGWRVPTARELFSIAHCAQGVGRLSEDVEDGGPLVRSGCLGKRGARTSIQIDVFPRTPNSWYLTSSVSKSRQRHIIAIDFDDANIRQVWEWDANLVRYVRANQ